jgi:hypothetical protein
MLIYTFSCSLLVLSFPLAKVYDDVRTVKAATVVFIVTVTYVYMCAPLSLSFLCVRERERDGQETEILCAVGLTLRHMKTIMDYYCILYIYIWTREGGRPL